MKTQTTYRVIDKHGDTWAEVLYPAMAFGIATRCNNDRAMLKLAPFIVKEQHNVEVW